MAITFGQAFFKAQLGAQRSGDQPSELLEALSLEWFVHTAATAALPKPKWDVNAEPALCNKPIPRGEAYTMLAQALQRGSEQDIWGMLHSLYLKGYTLPPELWPQLIAFGKAEHLQPLRNIFVQDNPRMALAASMHTKLYSSVYKVIYATNEPEEPTDLEAIKAKIVSGWKKASSNKREEHVQWLMQHATLEDQPWIQQLISAVPTAARLLTNVLGGIEGSQQQQAIKALAMQWINPNGSINLPSQYSAACEHLHIDRNVSYSDLPSQAHGWVAELIGLLPAEHWEQYPFDGVPRDAKQVWYNGLLRSLARYPSTERWVKLYFSLSSYGSIRPALEHNTRVALLVQCNAYFDNQKPAHQNLFQRLWGQFNTKPITPLSPDVVLVSALNLIDQSVLSDVDGVAALQPLLLAFAQHSGGKANHKMRWRRLYCAAQLHVSPQAAQAVASWPPDDDQDAIMLYQRRAHFEQLLHIEP